MISDESIDALHASLRRMEPETAIVIGTRQWHANEIFEVVEEALQARAWAESTDEKQSTPTHGKAIAIQIDIKELGYILNGHDEEMVRIRRKIRLAAGTTKIAFQAELESIQRRYAELDALLDNLATENKDFGAAAQ